MYVLGLLFLGIFSGFCVNRLTVTGFVVVVVAGKGAWCVVALLMTLVLLSKDKSPHT